MREPNPARPLAEQDLARIDALLEAVNPDAAMVLEELDGFLCALSCSPNPLPRETVLALACGDEPGMAVSASAPRAELAGLIHRHQLSIVAALHAGEGLEPVMERDEAGHSLGNLWAIGFLRGIDAQPDEWAEIDESEQLADWLEPAGQLAEERDLETGAVVAPVEGERADVLDDMIEAAFAFYHHFERARVRATAPKTVRRTAPAPGRNDPCPCGSGRKYKLCCARN